MLLLIAVLSGCLYTDVDGQSVIAANEEIIHKNIQCDWIKYMYCPGYDDPPMNDSVIQHRRPIMCQLPEGSKDGN